MLDRVVAQDHSDCVRYLVELEAIVDLYLSCNYRLILCINDLQNVSKRHFLDLFYPSYKTVLFNLLEIHPLLAVKRKALAQEVLEISGPFSLVQTK